MSKLQDEWRQRAGDLNYRLQGNIASLRQLASKYNIHTDKVKNLLNELDEELKKGIFDNYKQIRTRILEQRKSKADSG